MPDWPAAEDLGAYIVKLYNRTAPNIDQTIHKIRTVNDV
jgi:hypothetical protein